MLNKKIKKEVTQEVLVQEQPKITFDYGVLEASRFYITTNKDFYEDMIENPDVIPVFTPELLKDPNTKEIHQHVSDLQFYVFRIPAGK